MNEKGTNFCSFSVGLEPATPAYEAVTQSIPPTRYEYLVGGMKFVHFSFIHNPSYLYLEVAGSISVKKADIGCVPCYSRILEF